MGDKSQQGADAPLAENEYIKDLFGILHEYGRDTGGLSAPGSRRWTGKTQGLLE